MPKLPRVSGAEAVRALERLGFAKARQSGSHVIMRCGQKGCVVPLHAELKGGTLAGVLRQAEVSVEELTSAFLTKTPNDALHRTLNQRRFACWFRAGGRGRSIAGTVRPGFPEDGFPLLSSTASNPGGSSYSGRCTPLATQERGHGQVELRADYGRQTEPI